MDWTLWRVSTDYMTAVQDHTDDMSFHQMYATWSVVTQSRGGGKAEERIHPYGEWGAKVWVQEAGY